MSSIVGSSKYSPLNNLLCQSLTTPTLPPECTYEPTWVKQKEKNEKLKKQQQQSQEEKMDVVIKKEIELPDIKREIKSEPMSPMPTKQIIAQLKTQNMKTSTDANANPILNKFLSQGPSNNYLNRNLHPPPMESPSSNFTPNPYTSPYGAAGGPIMKIGMNMPTPSHPPPPYEMHKMNKLVGQPLSSTGSVPKVSEASSLLVNVLLYDTSLNIFRDHNFDSCTICVCNATPKCVGNIRGLDAGIYLSLTSNCHFNTNISAIVDKSFEGHSVDPRGITKYLGHSKNFIHSDTPNTNVPALPSMNCPSCQPSPIPTSELVPSLISNPTPLNLSGYVDDDPIFCHCGFSAVINRRLAHQTGLFYEDEIEITGMARDPSNYKKRSLMALLSDDGKKDDNLENVVIKKEPGTEDKMVSF
jgi:mediator of RNA polymerase II transcription subunit 13